MPNARSDLVVVDPVDEVHVGEALRRDLLRQRLGDAAARRRAPAARRPDDADGADHRVQVALAVDEVLQVLEGALVGVERGKAAELPRVGARPRFAPAGEHDVEVRGKPPRRRRMPASDPPAAEDGDDRSRHCAHASMARRLL